MAKFKYTVQTPEEIKQEQEKFLLCSGTCRWELLQSSPAVSQTQNDMFKLKLRVTDKNGKQAILYDYLIDIDSMRWKTRHFIESAGYKEKYDTGELDSDWLDGCSGLCEVVTKFDATYGKQSKIKDYLPPSEQYEVIKDGIRHDPEPFIDDDIGF